MSPTPKSFVGVSKVAQQDLDAPIVPEIEKQFMEINYGEGSTTEYSILEPLSYAYSEKQLM